MTEIATKPISNPQRKAFMFSKTIEIQTVVKAKRNGARTPSLK
jgi:hypothetical protein